MEGESLEKRIWDYFYVYDSRARKAVIQEAQEKKIDLEEKYTKENYLSAALLYLSNPFKNPFMALAKEEEKKEKQVMLKEKIQILLESNTLEKEEEKRFLLFWKYLGRS